MLFFPWRRDAGRNFPYKTRSPTSRASSAFDDRTPEKDSPPQFGTKSALLHFSRKESHPPPPQKHADLGSQASRTHPAGIRGAANRPSGADHQVPESTVAIGPPSLRPRSI